MHMKQFDFYISGDPFVSNIPFVCLVQCFQHCPPHSPLEAIAVHDYASELDKTICIFCFAFFYISAFPVWCFSLEEAYATLHSA